MTTDTHYCWSCLSEVSAGTAFCEACEGRRQTKLECNACGRRPSDHALISPDAQAGDQCPCCYIPDLDCDGVLVVGDGPREVQGVNLRVLPRALGIRMKKVRK